MNSLSYILKKFNFNSNRMNNSPLVLRMFDSDTGRLPKLSPGHLKLEEWMGSWSKNSYLQVIVDDVLSAEFC